MGRCNYHILLFHYKDCTKQKKDAQYFQKAYKIPKKKCKKKRAIYK